VIYLYTVYYISPAEDVILGNSLTQYYPQKLAFYTKYYIQLYYYQVRKQAFGSV
jgi:hypothetical protein